MIDWKSVAGKAAGSLLPTPIKNTAKTVQAAVKGAVSSVKGATASELANYVIKNKITDLQNKKWWADSPVKIEAWKLIESQKKIPKVKSPGGMSVEAAKIEEHDFTSEKKKQDWISKTLVKDLPFGFFPKEKAATPYMFSDDVTFTDVQKKYPQKVEKLDKEYNFFNEVSKWVNTSLDEKMEDKFRKKVQDFEKLEGWNKVAASLFDQDYIAYSQVEASTGEHVTSGYDRFRELLKAHANDIVDSDKQRTRAAEGVFEGIDDVTGGGASKVAETAINGLGYFVDIVERPMRKVLLPWGNLAVFQLSDVLSGKKITERSTKINERLAEYWAGGSLDYASKILAYAATGSGAQGQELENPATLLDELLETETGFRQRSLKENPYLQGQEEITFLGIPAMMISDTIVSLTASAAEGMIGGGLIKAGAASNWKGLGAILMGTGVGVETLAKATWPLTGVVATTKGGYVGEKAANWYKERASDPDFAQNASVLEGMFWLNIGLKTAGFTLKKGIEGTKWSVDKAGDLMAKLQGDKAFAERVLTKFKKEWGLVIENSYRPETGKAGELKVGDVEELRKAYEALPKPLQDELRKVQIRLFYEDASEGNRAGYYTDIDKKIGLNIDTARVKASKNLTELSHVLVHELGHFFEKRLSLDPDLNAKWQALIKPLNFTDAAKKPAFQPVEGKGSYMLTSPGELFAEGMRRFVREPGALKAQFPELFKFMDEFNTKLADKKLEAFAIAKQGVEEMPRMKSEDVIKKVADDGQEPPAKTRRAVGGIKKFFTDVLEYVQNSEERMRQIVGNAKVTDISDPYLKATLYPGKVATKIAEANNEMGILIKDMKKDGDELKIGLEGMRKQVNDYLLFKHAPERNAALGDGAAGITTKEAVEGLKAIEDSPEGAKVKAFAERALALNEKTLDVLRDSGVITQELHTLLREKYKNHVPLQRIMGESEDVGAILAGQGFDVKSSGIKAAKGSLKKVDDILANIMTNYEQALLRSEKNIVDQATLAFVKDNSEMLAGQMEIVAPKVIGKNFSGGLLTQKTNDPLILQMYDKGKPVWIKFNDKNLAIAFKGIGREKLGLLLNMIGTFTRLYSGLATRFNPEFALPNKIRDMQETMVYMFSQKGIGAKGAIKTATKDPASIKAVLDFLRGKETPGALQYKEMKKMGGTTGGFGLSTKTEVKINIEKLEALAQSKTRRIADKLVEYVDNWNTIFEDSTRLSVYKQALESGMSKERAAFLAKEASINFNRMGKGGPVINSLYMFSNASIQGSVKMMRALKNPKVLAAVTLTVTGAVSAVNQWNDQVDPKWRDKVSKWDRLNGLPIVLPSEDGGVQYVTIPVSWGIKPIKVMADYTYDAVTGQEVTAKEMINDTTVALLEAYNPVGGTNLVSALVPTILDVPVDIARNLSWSGNKIKPDWDANAPEDIKYFDSLNKTTTGQVAISISEALQKGMNFSVSPADIKYAFDSYIGGAGRSISKTFNLIAGIGTGEVPPLKEFPLLSRFYRSRTEEEVGIGTAGQDVLKGKLGEQSRERFNFNKKAEALYEELKALPREEANARAVALQTEDPAMYKKVAELQKEDKLGLTYKDKLVKQLGVENGERAKYIWGEVSALQTRDEKNTYLKELRTKKILTKEVDAQLLEFKKVKREAEDEEEESDFREEDQNFLEELGGVMKDMAILQDPATAMQILFSEEQLKDIRGGAIIMKRMRIEESQAVRERGGATETDRLDHVVPLELGGDNSKGNLKVVTETEWKSYTPIENYLGKLLNEGKLREIEAQAIIRGFKDGVFTAEQIYQLK